MTMPIDVRTLCLASTLTVLALATAMTYVWWQRKTYPGFGTWVASAWCSLGGMVFLTLRGWISDHLSIHGANAFLNVGTLLVVAGFCAFRDQPTPWGRLSGLFLGALGLSALFHYVHPSLQLRVAIHSLFTGGLCLWAAALAWPALPQGSLRPNGLVRVTLLILGLVYGLRGLASLVMPPASQHFMAPALLQQGALMAYLLGQAALFTGLLVLNGQRVEADLERTLAEYRKLRGLIPICANCKKIRDDQGVWDPLETYLHQHAGVDFTHGLCPDCVAAFRTEGLSPGSAAPG